MKQHNTKDCLYLPVFFFKFLKKTYLLKSVISTGPSKMSYKVCSACCNSCFDSIRWSTWHLLMQFQTWYCAVYTPSIRARSCTFNNIGKIIGALSVLPLPVFSWCYCFVPNATFCSTHLNHARRLSYQHTWTVAVYGKPCHPLVMCVCRWMRGGHSQHSLFTTHTLPCCCSTAFIL